MTAAGWIWCGCLVGFGLLAGLWLGWHLRGSYKAELAEHVVNKLHNEVGDLADRVKELERRAA